MFEDDKVVAVPIEIVLMKKKINRYIT